jgi:putative transposase
MLLTFSEGLMKKRYNEEQIVRILREADKDPIAEIAKRHGVSKQSIYSWRKRFSSMPVNDVKQMRQLTQENGRLKKLLAERDLEIEVMKEINAVVSAPARRIAALYAMSHGISQRRACALMHTTRANLFYVPSLPQKHAPTVLAMRRLSAQYPRYGSKRIHIFLGREGIKMGHEQCRRLWAEHGLQVSKNRARKHVAEKHPCVLAPAMVNAVWSYDFIFDA